MNSSNVYSYNDFQPSRPNSGSISDRIKTAWSGVTLFVRFVMISTVVLYILSYFTDTVQYLVNIPYYSLGSFHIWTFVTTAFVTPGLLNIIFAFIAWVPDAIRLENTSGTIRYALNFIVNSTFINLLFAFFMVFLSLIMGSNTSVLRIPSAGLWPVLISEITMLCLANPDNQVSMFFIPIQFSSRYYPWILFGFFCLINMSIRFDMLTGIIYGYLFFNYLRSKIQFNDNMIMNVEEYGIVKYFAKFTGFIGLQVSTGYSGFSTNYQQVEGQQTYQSRSNMDVNAFKGKGTVVGKSMINFRLLC